MNNLFTRRTWLKSSASLLAAGALTPRTAQTQAPQPAQPPASAPQDADRARRMQWWHEARFGMFVHWGLYSVLGRHVCVMENEAIPVIEYAPLTKECQQTPHAVRAWPSLTKHDGQKNMMTCSIQH